MSILRLEHVSKSFGALKVTQDVSFELGAGEALGIIGPNGAGKSTLFNLITGNIALNEGQIWLNEKDVTHQTPMQRCVSGVGRSFQIPQPFSGLSSFENLVVAARFGGGKSSKEAPEFCREILERTGLGAQADVPAKSLSLLSRKRLELARALATEPKVLLLDEIAGGLTEGECQELVATIRALHQGGTSIIWIEHVLHALNSVVERLLVLNFGKVVMMGPPAQVMASAAVQEIYLGVEA